MASGLLTIRNAVASAAVLCIAVLTPTFAGAQAPAAPPAPPARSIPPAPARTDAHTESRAASQGEVTASPAVDEAGKPLDGSVSSSHGVLVDQVIAVVNSELVLESDVDEERRFQAFQPFRDASGKFSRDASVERLIDRTLILQQARLQPENAVPMADATAQLASLRKDIPACKEFHCETEAGWEAFVRAQGFTVQDLTERWQQRMQILKFIEERFRAGIRIAPEEIRKYYDATVRPEYAAHKSPPPALDTISDRIQEILLQQQVTNLLSDWLKTLKAEGTVRVMRPGEVEP